MLSRKLHQMIAISEDISRIGPDKPLGYDNLRLYEGKGDGFLQAMCRQLEAKGLKTLVLKGTDCVMRAGALYAYDDKALRSMLQERRHILQQNSWPLEPEAFIRRLALEWTPEKTPLFDTIADIFNDKAHPGRMDIPVPEHRDGFSDQYLACVREREKDPSGTRRCKPP